MELQLVTFEAGGILVGGTVEMIALHIEESWALGAMAVIMIREELIVDGGVALADELAPLCLGGVELLKLQSAIHDTYHCANLMPSKLRKLKEKELRQTQWPGRVGCCSRAGEEDERPFVWQSQPESAHCCLQ